MPWAIFNRPSIQLGALKSYIEQELDQSEVQCLHPYLDVAAAVGRDRYRRIAESPWAAEALYCGLLFPGQQAQAEQVYRQSFKEKPAVSYPELLLTLKKQLHSWLNIQDFSTCNLVGFSVCFSQLPASLYASRAIKKRWPDIPVVFGGSTCTPALGRSLLKIFPEIDYIITGEGEQPLKELIMHLSRKTKLTSPCILGREPAAVKATEQKKHEIADLVNLPLPDYDDYFKQMKTSGLDFIPVLPLEFSRGCWWNKCTFCNLNLQWHGYRFKKSLQVTAEVKKMVQQYHCLDFTFTDNALPVNEADLFFADVVKSKQDLRFFGEIRTLKKAAAYKRYSSGGLKSVQIGIEALSDSLLKRMCKGTRVMENIAAMKFAQAAGMDLDGNLILEFPGSTEQEVNDTLRLLDMVLPFRPLTGAGFFLGHGSPVCNRPQEFGIRSVVQHPNNRKLYPPEILNNLDMLIKSYRGDRTVQTVRWKPVRNKIDSWHAFHRNRSNQCVPPLSYRDGGTFLIIRQELPAGSPLHHRLRGLSRQIYLACEQPVTRKELLTRFSQVTKEQLFSFLTDLEQKNILYCDTESCLALAIKTA
jgi:ribosomal peptide maturation radical SAM protein 1